MCWLAAALTLLLAGDAAAQATSGFSRFGSPRPSTATKTDNCGNVNGEFAACSQLLDLSEPSCGVSGSCAAKASDADIGRVRVIYIASPYDAPSNAVRGSHVTAVNSSATAIFPYQRSETTKPPTACSTPCFSYLDAAGAGVAGTAADLDIAQTCEASGESAAGVNPRRGVRNGANRGDEVDNYRSVAAAQRSGGSPPLVILANRFDVVTRAQMAISGFDESMLIETTGHDATVTWFAGDPNEWNWSHACTNAAWRDRDVYGGGDPDDPAAGGIRLNDQISSLGGDPSDYSYMLIGPDDAAYVCPNGVMADQNDVAYRSWKINSVISPLMADSGADMVLLNHKLFQYDYDAPTAAVGASDTLAMYCADYATPADFFAGTAPGGQYAGDDCWTGDVEAAGYGLEEYVAGLVALGSELHAAGIRWSISVSGALLRVNSLCAGLNTGPNSEPWSCCSGVEAGDCDVYDDPDSAGTNEQLSLRNLIRSADFWEISTSGNPNQDLLTYMEAEELGMGYVVRGCP